MNIGLIIFVVSVVISLISAVNDKNYKKRQQNQPKSSQPRKQPTTERKPQKGFLEQLGEKFEEMQKEFEDAPSSSKPEESPKTKETSRPNRRTSQPRQVRKQSSPSRMDQTQKGQVLTQQLNDSLNDELQDLRSQMDREKQKQIEILERRAQAIITDKYLSERAKKERLKQLFANKFNQSNPRTNEDLRFDDDEILNGFVWSEVLKKPKQLQ
ncbi:hypothetical protein [Staphylococcus simulans]|uniref:hypothetical protein n=1 Tax=Staphylococcus simulans TaxID=1286 RepID=UPI00399C4903